MTRLKCSFCSAPLTHSFADLGMSPLANAYLEADDLFQTEGFYPLQAYVCESCYLVQVPAVVTPDQLFSDYAYFSSFSENWLEHSKSYVKHMIERFDFGPASQVIEIASNDGYLLQYFKERGIPVLGIEPARNVAEVAEAAGIPTVAKFFGVETAAELVAQGKKADLLLGNNVLAHVPDLNDFVEGMKRLLQPRGVITMEFPHLMRLMEGGQFDTIYHEHFSYFSLITVEKVFSRHGLTLFNVDELPTHGGSLRIYARHTEDTSEPVCRRLSELLAEEEAAGFTSLEHYFSFAEQVRAVKLNALEFLISVKRKGESVAAYGAAAKGNVFLNYCGIRSDFIDYTVDRSPHKQGRFLPGTHIPIYSLGQIRQTRPDYLLILAWNLKEEIMAQMAYIREWRGKFVVLIPEVKVYP